MKDKLTESLAILVTCVGVIAAVVWPFFYEADSVGQRIPPGTQIITLTGVASTGTWTEEKVTGGNYWRSNFRPARPVLRVGRPTLLRLKSADVVHSFYAPSLGIDRTEVYPGHVVEVLFTPQKEGVFGYFCPSMCGDPHFGMRGVVIVQGHDATIPEVQESNVDRFWTEPPPAAEEGRRARGAWLFRQKGCVTCHGTGGEGGIHNWNYVNDTVPALNNLSEKMFLRSRDDVRAIVDLMEQGSPLESFADAPPVRRFNVVLAKYKTIRDVIKKGNPAGKKDPEGPAPPLEMPAWETRLSEHDIDAIIEYLLSLELLEDS